MQSFFSFFKLLIISASLFHIGLLPASSLIFSQSINVDKDDISFKTGLTSYVIINGEEALIGYDTEGQYIVQNFKQAIESAKTRGVSGLHFTSKMLEEGYETSSEFFKINDNNDNMDKSRLERENQLLRELINQSLTSGRCMDQVKAGSRAGKLGQAPSSLSFPTGTIAPSQER